MRRLSRSSYRRVLAVLMAAYVLLMLFAWPAVRQVHAPAARIALALAPVVPVIGVIALMARRVMGGDELEQRVHMLALGAATALVAVASLVAGFLAAAGVLALGGDVLIFVFPALCVLYGALHWRIARHYGGGCR